MNFIPAHGKMASFAVAHGVGSWAVLVAGCGNPGTTTYSPPGLVDATSEGAADPMSIRRLSDASDASDATDATDDLGLDSGYGDPTSDGSDGNLVSETSDGNSLFDASDGAVTGPAACGLTPCVPGAPCADLTIDRADLLASMVIDQRTFQPTDCGLYEGCITTPGTRKLLRFDTAVVNSGTADLVIGDTSQNACFTYSNCHMHYHFRGVGVYTLYGADGKTVAAVGHKQGFCVDDTRAYPQLQPPPANPAKPYDCMNQGLHVGWEDLYPADIDCQWVDITGVPSGQYILSVKANAEHYLPESNYDNNEERVPVTIP
jgi:hypothetical protein